eukprot:TRINITY_DN1478_c0_g1_i6.p1 TRINITY_DN1478_c0_g1~~TRINITY_DN1478_c0_g1_i6.p1  ORF type:complete len:763 (+),score=213.85 TRINITY_DN1478_c0_g1_i6:54-2342(+)
MSAVFALAALAATGTPTGNMAYTCAPGSVESKYPFCDRKLGFEARSQDLMKRLNTTEKVMLWGHSYPGTEYIERYNMKTWSLDHTCIHGVNKAHGVTVFAHAIAQGASFDRDLVARISNATSIEARILSEKEYQNSHGESQASVLSCDGGPLANSAHDPRWGRISETYGEDPYLIQQIGVTAMRSLQNQQAVPDSPGDYFMATRQVTRHFLGYHGARPDLEYAIMNATQRSLGDSYIPTYGSYQDPELGNADGIMCAISSVNGVPSCANPYLLTDLLRKEWNSDALVQTDCCDSISTINDPFHYKGVTTDTEALVLAADAGVQVYYGFRGGEYIPAMTAFVENGTIPMSILDSAAARVIKSMMKLGLYDTYAADFPWKNLTWSQLDSPQHRSLARESAAKSTVLLKNDGVLPLSPNTYKNVAVIGPFANCTECLLQSYNGYPSAYTTIFQGISNRTHATYSLGSNTSCPTKADNTCWTTPGVEADAITAAVNVAKDADLTILVVGLGSTWEGEGNDRVNMTLPTIQAALQQAVEKVSKKVIIVSVSAGGVDLDETTAGAVVYAPYGGEEGGSGLADVLFGDFNPSAKMPVTVYKQSWADSMNQKLTTSIGVFDLEAGIGRTHRYVSGEYVKHGFGFGLSYTTFAYSNLKIVSGAGDDAATITFTITNTGSRAGADVAQVYASVPTVSGLVTPQKNFVGFEKVTLEPKQSQTVTLNILKSSLETAQNDGTRVLTSATYTFFVGGNQPGETGSSGAGLKGTLQL